jgi:hypothetical protein
VLAIAEDHVNRDLLFVGTEFGLFFTTNGGQKWTQLRNGLPTIAVRDLAIQRRENDLVVGTFGRGIYILDDYSPLRSAGPELVAKEANLFQPRNALLYVETSPYGGRGKANQGESFFTANNPPFGATITYYLKDALRTKKQRRQEAERAAERAAQRAARDGGEAQNGASRSAAFQYPTHDQLREEEEEEPPRVLLTVFDSSGKVVRRLSGPVTAGMHRVTWDLRHPAPALSQQQRTPDGEEEQQFGRGAPSGPLVSPGKYSISLSKVVNGVSTELAGPQSFTVIADGSLVSSPADVAALSEFQQKLSRLQRALSGAIESANSLRTRLGMIERALLETPSADGQLTAQTNAIERKLNEIQRALRGDQVLRSRNENTPPSISERVNGIAGELRLWTSRPTKTHIEQYEIAADLFAAELAKLRTLIEVDAASLDKALEATGAPWTPGRLPEWKN